MAKLRHVLQDMDFYIRRRELIILEYNNLKQKPHFDPEKFVEAITRIHKTIIDGPSKYAPEILHFI